MFLTQYLHVSDSGELYRETFCSLHAGESVQKVTCGKLTENVERNGKRRTSSLCAYIKLGLR